jgi:hypothetical protein
MPRRASGIQVTPIREVHAVRTHEIQSNLVSELLEGGALKRRMVGIMEAELW